MSASFESIETYRILKIIQTLTRFPVNWDKALIFMVRITTIPMQLVVSIPVS